jgi:hypothetical protein
VGCLAQNQTAERDNSPACLGKSSASKKADDLLAVTDKALADKVRSLGGLGVERKTIFNSIY